jgi:hypothetical protein
MLIANRYLKHYWRHQMWIHSIFGTINLLLNIFLGLGVIIFMDWSAEKSIHGVVGTFLSSIVILGCILGSFARHA